MDMADVQMDMADGETDMQKDRQAVRPANRQTSRQRVVMTDSIKLDRQINWQIHLCVLGR